ncbi:MAG: glycosyltransferase family 2 protein [Candidatus Brocadiaceae bacterium]|jgi:glycosyltransferase involved in cell wall biosynthesis
MVSPDTVRSREGKAASSPRVSVVIPAYNAEDYLQEALESVFAQTFTDYEVIVVDDASTDGTPEMLRGYEESGRIRVLTHQRNRGLSASRNSGIRAARGEFVTFLDADDVWRPERLAYHMAVMERNPEIMFLSNSGWWFKEGEELRFPPLPENPELTEVSWEALALGASPFSASNALVRREVLDEVGLFDERLRAAEDRDMWLRIARRFGTVRASGYVHGYRRHAGSMTADPEHMKRNMKMVLGKALRDARPSLRHRAYAQLYLDVAITCYTVDRRFAALGNLGKSVLAWPFVLASPAHPTPLIRWIWAGKMLLGRELFERLWGFVRGRLIGPRGKDRAGAPGAVSERR